MPNRSKNQKPPHAARRVVTELCHPSARPEMSCVSARCMPAGLQGKHPSRALHLSPDRATNLIAKQTNLLCMAHASLRAWAVAKPEGINKKLKPEGIAR